MITVKFNPLPSMPPVFRAPAGYGRLTPGARRASRLSRGGRRGGGGEADGPRHRHGDGRIADCVVAGLVFQRAFDGDRPEAFGATVTSWTTRNDLV